LVRSRRRKTRVVAPHYGTSFHLPKMRMRAVDAHFARSRVALRYATPRAAVCGGRRGENSRGRCAGVVRGRWWRRPFSPHQQGPGEERYV